MTGDGLEPHFIDAARGRLFVLLRGPASATNAVMIVPPFAEEMNKARRMITEVTRALALRGTAAVCPDLFGTGDSQGEFGEADWGGWIEDLATVDAWSRARGLPITGVLAIRLGCPLAASYFSGRGRYPEKCVFWQPVLDGARYMDQFLRLKVAAGMLGQQPRRTVSDLRRDAQTSGGLEVAGYELSADLLADIGEVRLAEQDVAGWPVLHWFELVRDAQAPMPLPVTRLVDRLRAEGCDVQPQTIVCPPIWTSTEIVVSPELARVTVQALCS